MEEKMPYASIAMSNGMARTNAWLGSIKPAITVAQLSIATASVTKTYQLHIDLIKKPITTHYCYPRGYRGEEGVEYRNNTNEVEAWDYHITFEPMFYTERARQAYYDETYWKRQAQKEREGAEKQREQAENMEASDIEYDENDVAFDQMYTEFTKQPNTRDYGPPYEHNEEGFGTPTEDANPNKSGGDLNGRKKNADGNKNATSPIPKPRTNATSQKPTPRTKVAKNKAKPQPPKQPEKQVNSKPQTQRTY